MALSGYGPNFANQTGSVNDGEAQLRFLEAYDIPVNGAYIPTSSYPISYSAFKTSTNAVGWLAAAWEYNYERGTWNAQRAVNAQYWESRLPQIIGQSIPVWMYFKFKGRG